MLESGVIAANGHELYYEAHGEGPPLVLVMGIGYDASLWLLQQVPALARHFRIIAFDNRDAGRSSRASAPYGIGDMADDLSGLLDALDVARAHVLGVSMGGMIAQEFALRHPGRLDRLVLCATAAATARSACDPIRVWSWVHSADADGAMFAEQQFVWLFSPRFLRDREAVAQTRALLASNPHPVGPDAYARQAAAYLAHDALERLGSVRAPALVVGGERDLLTPPWIVREVADAIPGARLEILRGEGASHLVMLERPDEFNALVSDFLLESDRTQ